MARSKDTELQITSSSRVFSPPLIRCCILSRRTSSMSRNILFRLALMFVLISSSCSFAKSCRNVQCASSTITQWEACE